MITLSACIEMMFREEPDFLKRIDMAADCGFRAVEFWGTGNKDIDGIKARAEARGVAVSIFGGPGGTLGDPATHADLVRAMRETIPLADKLGTKRLIVTVGNEIEGMSRATQHANIVAGLKKLAPVVEDAGLTLCLEPLNILVDHMGYYLATSAEAFEMVDEVGSPALKLLFDIYHQQITEGNLTANLTRNAAKIGHLHVADVPGRHEPGTGEINYRNVFAALLKCGWEGYAGLEYAPSTELTQDSVANILAIRDELGMG
ncbi:MAG: TIM barrel protein [Armatimonadetes bacterium]|jgi:hydroxypyruvate isomerase|nr:TIM barrel protein [Armatimonadota bacterium]MDI9602131.1 TIM barrel protein [Acidobacteriota bacterium]